MNLADFIAGMQGKSKICQFGFTTTDRLCVERGVRDLCEMNFCGLYGKSWTCPPAVGSFGECRKKIMRHENVFVYTTLHAIEDPFDFEGMTRGKEAHGDITKNVAGFFGMHMGGDVLILSGGGCSRCRACTCPEAPCRFPGEVFPTVESYGINVSKLAESAKVRYANGKDTVTYFGCVCYSHPSENICAIRRAGS